MNFQDYLKEQLLLHASTEPQDIVKQCYQAAFGAEHLLGDVSAAHECFTNEYAATPESNCPLIEHISPDVCRVNLAAWKYNKLPGDWLFRMFALTANISRDGSKDFQQNLLIADNWIRGGISELPYSEWEKYLSSYKAGDMGAIHHSSSYKEKEVPAYRVVNSRAARLLPVLQAIASGHRSKTPFVLALDGRAASGKTTAAQALSFIISGSVIHMDDFFLPPSMRTEHRLATPGGNVHHERFVDEVLPQLKKGAYFSYRIFDCKQMDYAGTRNIAASPYYIVEGSYSSHPALGGYADLSVFMDVDCEEQMARILRRNGASMAERFRTVWIPLEEEYFRFYQIKEKADIVVY